MAWASMFVAHGRYPGLSPELDAVCRHRVLVICDEQHHAAVELRGVEAPIVLSMLQHLL